MIVDSCLPIPIGSMYAIYGNMDPINIPPMLAYQPYMDPMGFGTHGSHLSSAEDSKSKQSKFMEWSGRDPLGS